jgi:hypothetical protein
VSRESRRRKCGGGGRRRAGEQLELFQALQLSLQRPLQRAADPAAAMKPGVLDPEESSGEVPEIDHWNPRSVADWVSTLERDETDSFTRDHAPEWLGTFLAKNVDRGAALVIGGYTIAIARIGQLFYLFDSHGYHPISQNAFCVAFSRRVRICASLSGR